MKDIFLIVVPTRFDSTSPTIERHLQKQQQQHLLSCLPLCKSVSNARASSQDAKSQSGSPCITLSTAASLNLLAVVREPSGMKRPRDTEDQLDSADYSKSPANPAPTIGEPWDW